MQHAGNVREHRSQVSTGCARHPKRLRTSSNWHAVLGLVPMSVALGACAPDAVSIGSGEEVLEPAPENPACPGGVLPNGVTTTTQADIDALAGCTEIAGNLTLMSFPGMDLSPLSELTVVRGDVNVGGRNNSLRSGQEVFLHGLEKLEEVNSLALRYVMDPDLSALRSLRRIGWQPGASESHAGLLEILSCDGLRDLSGLEALSEYGALIIERNARLTSLAGIHPAPSLRSLEVSGAVLTDISALAPIRSIDVFGLDHTAVANLDGFRFETVGLLRIGSNASLTRVDSLSSLTSLEALLVDRNDQLEELPSLDGVRDIRRVSISNNARLRSVPSFYGGSGGPQSGFGYSGIISYATSTGLVPSVLAPTQSLGFDMYEVALNPELTRIWSPLGGRAGHLVIHGNARLEEVEFPNANFLNGLILHDNAALGAFTMSEESRVVDLWVTNNPQLPTAFFENLTTMSSMIADNLPSSAP